MSYKSPCFSFSAWCRGKETYFSATGPAYESEKLLLFVILYILNYFVYKNFIFIHYSFDIMHIYAFSDEYSLKRNNIYKFFAEKY